MVPTLAVVLLCLIGTTAAAAASNSFQVEHIEIPTSAIILHESTLNLALQSNQGTLRFNLTRIQDRVSDVPVVVVREDGQIHKYLPPGPQTEPVLFQDAATGSIFIFQFREDNLVDMYARINHEGKQYLIRPSSVQQRRKKRSDPTASSAHQMELDHEYDASLVNFAEKIHLERASRQKRQITYPQRRWLEVLVLTDYDVYDAHQKYLGTSDVNVVIRHIKLYFTLVVKGIDVLYQNSFGADPELNLFIRLAGFTINLAPNVPWIDRTDVTPVGVVSSKKTADIDKTLTFFNDWVTSNAYQLQANDHVLGFTGRELYRNGALEFGAAFRGEICSGRKASLNMDFGKFFSVKIAARGIATNLNVFYDGDTTIPNGYAAGCPASNMNLMTSLKFTQTNIKNSYVFSSCSKMAMKRFISDSWSQTSCLNNMVSDNIDDPQWGVYYPGQIYDATEQCKIAYGPGTGYCAIYFDTDKDFMCHSLPCRRVATSTACYYDIGIGAATGTPCDDGKWCINGNCVASPNAPKGTCYAGDQGSTGATPGQQQTCADKFAEFQLRNVTKPTLCNTTLFKKICCRSCNVTGGSNPALLTQLMHSCTSNPCVNGACSEPASGSYYCTCQTGYTGRNCDSSTASCLSYPCLNGGTCVPQGSSYTCICQPEWAGQRCDQCQTSCFPGDSVVTLRDGTSLPLSRLSIGDVILTKDAYTNEPRFSPVLAFLDYKPRSNTEYLQIATVNKTQISITPLHLILMIRDGAQRYVLSREVKTGDELLVFHSGAYQLETVQSVSVASKVGAFAPLTETGTVVVDGVAASCYAVTSSHQLAHWALAPLRWWSMAKRFFALLPEEMSEGIHMYADWLYILGKDSI